MLETNPIPKNRQGEVRVSVLFEEFGS